MSYMYIKGELYVPVVLVLVLLESGSVDMMKLLLKVIRRREEKVQITTSEGKNEIV